MLLENGGTEFTSCECDSLTWIIVFPAAMIKLVNMLVHLAGGDGGFANCANYHLNVKVYG